MNFKSLAVAAAVMTGLSTTAMAVPISGSFSLSSFGGSYVTTGAYTTDNATSMNATGLDFGAAFDSTGNGFGTNGTAQIGNSKGSFAGLNGQLASVADILLGATANPYLANPFISFGSSTAITVNFADATITRNPNGIRVAGTASFSDGNPDDDGIGTFNITTSTQTDNGAPTVNFTFTGNTGATAVPEPISLSILGAGLVGMGVIRLRRKS